MYMLHRGRILERLWWGMAQKRFGNIVLDIRHECYITIIKLYLLIIASNKLNFDTDFSLLSAVSV